MRFFHRIHSIISAQLLCLTLWFVGSSCSSLRNEVDPSLLGVQSKKLVITSYLSPQDTLLVVKVTRSATIVGDSLSLLQTSNIVTDATVTLAEGDRSVVLPFYKVRPSSDSAYSISARLLPIQAGRTYRLTVTTPLGERVTSTCTIPQPVVPSAITLDSLNQRYFIRVRWQDPAGQANYYQVAGILRYFNAGCKSCVVESYNTLSFDDDNRGLFTDVGLDGTVLVSGRAYLTPAAVRNFYNQYKTVSVTANLMSVDQAYYRFQEAAIRQRRSRNNPFAEPVIIPSNIDGALGCFAGYNNATVTLKLK